MNVNLLREEIKNNTSAIDDITLDTDEEAEKRRQERFKLVQEIRRRSYRKGHGTHGRRRRRAR